jgi:hypothetical protein
MLRNIFNSIVIFLFFLHPIYSEENSKQFTIDKNKQDQIFAKLLKLGNEKHSKFSGTISKRKVTNRHYDPETGKITELEEVLVERIEYFFKKPVVKAITYRKNGKDVDPTSFNPPLTEPPLPLFGPGSEKNYNLKIIGQEKIKGKLCYIINIQPNFKTDRHLIGKLFIDASSLEAVRLKGGLAKLPFGAKSLDLDINFSTVDGYNVASSGIVRYTAKVPLIIHEKVENEFQSIEDGFVK